MIRLGVNIDHVATLRNARGIQYPDPVKAAILAAEYGADGITVHLREDRRHIRDEDVYRIKDAITLPLNLEMANTPEMVRIALRLQPDMITLVPERREELTTEGGLDVATHQQTIAETVRQCQAAGISVSLFVDPRPSQIDTSVETGATIVELHTGSYCEASATGNPNATEHALQSLQQTADYGTQQGLTINAGHGLNLENIEPVLSLTGLYELNIGHSIISEAVFVGLGPAVQQMKEKLSQSAVENTSSDGIKACQS